MVSEFDPTLIPEMGAMGLLGAPYQVFYFSFLLMHFTNLFKLFSAPF